MRNKRFEAFFAKRIGLRECDVAAMFNGQTYVSGSYYVEVAWAAWCAALGFEEAI